MNLWMKLQEQEPLLEQLAKDHLSERVQQIIVGHVGMKTKIAMWMDHMSKTFFLSKDLIEAFKYTDIPLDLRPADFDYPFETFMIEGSIPLFETKISGELCPIHHLLYTSRAIVEKDPNARLIDFNLKQHKRIEWDVSMTAFFQSDLFLEFMMIHFDKMQTIEETLKVEREDHYLIPLDADDKRNMINLFYNTLLYINDRSRNRAETEEYRQRQFRHSKGGPFVSSDYIYLKPPLDHKSFYSGSSGRHIDKRFIIRGHWRNQAYGENYTKRRYIWIKPFTKGPMLAPVSNKAYVLS